MSCHWKALSCDRPGRKDEGVEGKRLRADQARALEARHARIVARTGQVRRPHRDPEADENDDDKADEPSTFHDRMPLGAPAR